MSVVLVDVDVQRDFCDPGGALAVAGSPNDRFEALVGWACARGVPILGSVDTHAFDAWEFASSDAVGPNGEDPGFPAHCVKGTPGWLKVPGTLAPRARFVPNVPGQSVAAWAHELADGRVQGVYLEKEVYSLFANPVAEPLVEALVATLEAPHFHVFGVATDYCVRAAVLGLRERGFRVTLLEDAIAAVDPTGGARAIEEMVAAGAELSSTAALLG